MTTLRMVRIVPHSHNQTITVGSGISPNLLSSRWILDESPHERPRATPWIVGDCTLHSQRSITAGGDLHPALRIAPRCEADYTGLRRD
jgi:hypothetical protein